jgi:hypothetical protein
LFHIFTFPVTIQKEAVVDELDRRPEKKEAHDVFGYGDVGFADTMKSMMLSAMKKEPLSICKRASVYLPRMTKRASMTKETATALLTICFFSARGRLAVKPMVEGYEADRVDHQKHCEKIGRNAEKILILYCIKNFTLG